MIFVGAHLTAHERLVEERNKNWEDLVRGLVFEDSKSSNKDIRMHGIYQPTAHLFVLGDLNYRTARTSPVPGDFERFPQPLAGLDNPAHAMALLRNDQLTVEKNAGRALHGLEEPEITFPPTFKFVLSRGEEYDPRKWNWTKWRWPSWCDRILYLPMPSDYFDQSTANGSSKHIQVYKYTSIHDICDSDHKPVALHVAVPNMPVRAGPSDIRNNPPFPIDRDWKTRRAAAKRREFVVGLLAWLLQIRLAWLFSIFTVIGGSIWWGWWLLAGRMN